MPTTPQQDKDTELRNRINALKAAPISNIELENRLRALNNGKAMSTQLLRELELVLRFRAAQRIRENNTAIVLKQTHPSHPLYIAFEQHNAAMSTVEDEILKNVDRYKKDHTVLLKKIAIDKLFPTVTARLQAERSTTSITPATTVSSQSRTLASPSPKPRPTNIVQKEVAKVKESAEIKSPAPTPNKKVRSAIPEFIADVFKILGVNVSVTYPSEKAVAAKPLNKIDQEGTSQLAGSGWGVGMFFKTLARGFSGAIAYMFKSPAFKKIEASKEQAVEIEAISACNAATHVAQCADEDFSVSRSPANSKGLLQAAVENSKPDCDNSPQLESQNSGLKI